MDSWLLRAFPTVQRWQYDDNSGDRSFPIFHVHVFIETIPYSFAPRPGYEYFPPHCQPQQQQQEAPDSQLHYTEQEPDDTAVATRDGDGDPGVQ